MDQEQNIQLPKYIPTDADYEKAEMDLLRDALKRTYTERFLMMTTLYKVQQTFKRMKIINSPDPLKK